MMITGTLRELAEHLDVPYDTLRKRVLRAGVRPVTGNLYRLADVNRTDPVPAALRRAQLRSLTSLTGCPKISRRWPAP